LPKTIAHRSVLISSASSIISVLSAYASPLPADVSGAAVVENHPSQLNEIVVTSQRRSENLQTIPLSVTAAIATELLNEGATDTIALSQTANLRHDAERELLSSCCSGTSFDSQFRAGRGAL
jgi:outer membrane receptor protein involved in Fe transport